MPKLVAKGQLTSSGKRGRSFGRDQEHEWLSPAQVAELVGVTKPAVIGRITRDKLPAVRNGGRLWVRRDLLEQVEAAKLVRKTRRP